MSIVKVLKCAYENCAVVVPLYPLINYEDLCGQLTLRFPSLSLGGFHLKYSLYGGEPNCLLECNEDIQTLLLVNNLISNPVVDVYVQAKKKMSIVSTSSVLSCISEATSIGDDNQFLGKYGSYKPHRYATNEWQSYISYEDQSYKDGAIEFRRKLTQYSIEVGFVFQFTRNYWKRVTVVCSKKMSEGCQWHVHAVVQQPIGCFIIKKLNNIHTCIGCIRQKENKRFNPSVLSSLLAAKFRSNPSIKANDVMREIKKNYGLDVNTMQLGMTKRLHIMRLMVIRLSHLDFCLGTLIMIVIGLKGYSYLLELVLKDSYGADHCCSLMVHF
ncbi:hypothetical protein ACFX1Z_018389 [Malus domestica]